MGRSLPLQEEEQRKALRTILVEMWPLLCQSGSVLMDAVKGEVCVTAGTIKLRRIALQATALCSGNFFFFVVPQFELRAFILSYFTSLFM
jgi:hypothetical protein